MKMRKGLVLGLLISSLSMLFVGCGANKVSVDKVEITTPVVTVEDVSEDEVIPATTPEDTFASLKGVWLEVTDLEDKLMIQFNEKGSEDYDVIVSYLNAKIMANAKVKTLAYDMNTGVLTMPLDLIFTEGNDRVDVTFTAKYINDGSEIFVDMEELQTVYRYVAPTMEEAMAIIEKEQK